MDEGLRDIKKTFLLETVVVRSDRITCLFTAAKENVVQLVRRLASADPHRAFATPPVVSTVLESFHASKIGKAMGVIPVMQARIRPTVEIQRIPLLKSMALMDEEPPMTRPRFSSMVRPPRWGYGA